MKIVGLTGGIGSGKTTVARMFGDLGVPVYDSDKEAKKLMRSSKKLKKAIIELFGAEAYKDKKLNKKYISNKIFNNRDLLEKLNSIVHPAVRKHFLSWAKKQKTVYVIQEAAIIYENGKHGFYDKIILVTAPQSTRIKRVMDRDKVSKQEVVARIKHQWPDEKKIPLSDFIIENLDLEKTRTKVFEVNLALLENS